ncbi:hypothetical protein V5O48_005340 [Marasmius crinis-equi]|uniref:Uncharacterized protein n=1 Tax=Marasmius crinis-equi TaxID=585013 RepID=A0ABR3FMJ3_9AGAR
MAFPRDSRSSSSTTLKRYSPPLTATGSAFPASPTYVDLNTSSVYGSERGSTSSGRTVRDSTHLIPSIVDNKAKKFHPFTLRLPIAVGVPIIMFAMGIALEVALAFSERNNGFSVPKNNAFKLSFASAQFLQAFVPTILIIPIAVLWRELDWHVRQFQPYVILSKGNASAEETLLNDYVGLGVGGSVINALRFKHRLVFWSSLLALISYSLQPLAGSIFQIQQRGEDSWGTVNNTKRIGLAPDIAELNAFVASAGFAEAAVYSDLADPPFVRGGWSIAEFKFPTDQFLNGSMVVNTTSIQTKVNCKQPKDVSVTQTTSQSQNFTITSTSVDNCIVNVTFDPSLAAQQYGVADASCNSNPSLNVTFRPVMFWYFHLNTRDSKPEARTVFCAPTIRAFNVEATASLNNGSLTDVTQGDEYIQSNNVTQGDFAGKAFNGVLFEQTGNPFINARGLAATSGIPGAVFRSVSQGQDSLQAAFDQPNGFLDNTTKIYTQHLALAAKNVYFTTDNTSMSAKMVSLLPRLVISKIPGHGMALNMVIIGVIGLIVQLVHRQQRKRLFLAAPPGTIASVMALSSHSGFGQLLMPYDNEENFAHKLSGLRFRLDRRTGALVADEHMPSMAKMKKERDEALQTLLGEHKNAEGSSSDAAFEAARGYPPWQTQYRTPYDA